VLLTLSLGFFMTLLDLTIVNIAIPSMITNLHASLDQVLWVVNAYALALAALLITAGRLGDRFGQRTLFMIGVGLFTVASLGCGLAQNPVELIGARVLQGIGAAALIPQTMAIIIATFPAQRRGTALGVWGAVAGLSTVAGPTLGGLLITGLGWQWIFFINVPIGVAVLVAAMVYVPDLRLGRRHRFDWAGVGLATTGLLALVFGLTEGQRYDWNGWVLGVLAVAVVLIGAFVLQQRAAQDGEPLVPIALLADRGFTVFSLVGALVSLAVLGYFIPITIYLQSVLGYSALKAGLVLAPSSVVSMVVAPMAGRLSDRVGGRNILIGGLTLFAIGGAWTVAVARVGTSWPTLMPPMIITGIGLGCTFAPMATEALRGVPARLAGAASGVNSTVRQVGSALGSAMVGAVLQNRLAVSLHAEAVQRAGQLPAAVRDRFVAGFSATGHGGAEITAGPPTAPPQGVPGQLAGQLQRLALDVFHQGFVRAMHPTLVVPIAALLVAALACLAVPRRRTVGHEPEGGGRPAQLDAVG
jgi:EmrB/QacA subfamily drug resistance transporter